MAILDAIRQAIEQSGKTRYRISKDTGIGESQLCTLMKGQIGLSQEKLTILTDYLGLEIIVRPKRSTNRGKHQ
jgi:predicted XRE-type DNA-binding protein